MITEISPKCKKILVKLKKKNGPLFNKFEKQLFIFCENPNHPSLRLHKLRGMNLDIWSISVDMSYRLLFRYRQVNQEKIAVFFTAGRHEDVYS